MNFVNEYNEMKDIIVKINDYIINKFPKQIQDKVNALGNDIEISVAEDYDFIDDSMITDFELKFDVTVNSVYAGELYCEQINDGWGRRIYYSFRGIKESYRTPWVYYENLNFDEVLNNKEFIENISDCIKSQVLLEINIG